MRKFITAVCLCLAMAAPAQAFDLEWSWKDTAYEAAFLGMHAANYILIKDNLKKSEPYQKYDMTDQPDIKAVGTGAAVSAGAHIIAALLMPPDWREKFQLVTIGMETGLMVYGVALSVQLK